MMLRLGRCWSVLLLPVLVVRKHLFCTTLWLTIFCAQWGLWCSIVPVTSTMNLQCKWIIMNSCYSPNSCVQVGVFLWPWSLTLTLGDRAPFVGCVYYQVLLSLPVGDLVFARDLLEVFLQIVAGCSERFYYYWYYPSLDVPHSLYF